MLCSQLRILTWASSVTTWLTPPRYTGPLFSPEHPLVQPAIPSALAWPPLLPSSSCSGISSSESPSLTILTIASVRPTANPGFLLYLLHSIAEPSLSAHHLLVCWWSPSLEIRSSSVGHGGVHSSIPTIPIHVRSSTNTCCISDD